MPIKIFFHTENLKVNIILIKFIICQTHTAFTDFSYFHFQLDIFDIKYIVNDNLSKREHTVGWGL